MRKLWWDFLRCGSILDRKYGPRKYGREFSPPDVHRQWLRTLLSPPRMLLAWKAVSFLFLTIRWHSNACTRNWVGWREGSLDDHASRKPLLSSVFALHHYANKMRKFYSKCVNIIEFAKDFCLNPRQKTDVQDYEEMRSRVKKQESLPAHPSSLQLFIPWTEALAINTLQCGFLWDCGSYGA